MTGRVDIPALVVGLLGLMLAGLGLWRAFGAVNWSLVGVAIPLVLVLVGLLGLVLSRPRS